jgi:hypothetical protein
MKKNNIKLLAFTLLAMVSYSCEDFLDVQPVDIISNQIVIEDDESAVTAVLGMYSIFQQAGQYSEQVQLTSGLLSDEMVHTGSFPTRAQYDNNTVLADNTTMRNIWSSAYEAIYIANTILERVPLVDAIDPALGAEVMGEAYFGRAWAHFNTLNYFGDVPIVGSTDLVTNLEVSRSSVSDVYAQILSDLGAAESSLPDTYGSADEDKTRATSWGAKAMLARVHLYLGNWSQAEAKATEVINSGVFSLETGVNYTNIFLGGSSESILEVFASSTDQNGLAFLCLPGGRYEHGVAKYKVDEWFPADNAAGDARFGVVQVNDAFDIGGNFYYCNKYTDLATGTDKPIVLRLAEMYLIRAEALLNQSGSADADLNVIRARAGLGNITGATQADILYEREIELAFEGHRWHDLKRTGTVDAVMGADNPTNWDPAVDKLLPIPQREIEQNPNLVQNPGYGGGS